MKTYANLVYIVAISAALGTIPVTATAATTFWDQLNTSAPRSVFDDIRDSAPVRAHAKDHAGE